MTKRETAQKLAPWAAIIVALLGTINAYIDSRAAKRKAVNEAKDQAEETREWTDERAARAYQAIREKLREADRQHKDLYYRMSLLEEDLDSAIELLGARPQTGTQQRDYEAKVHALKTRNRPGGAPSLAPLGDWLDVQGEPLVKPK